MRSILIIFTVMCVWGSTLMAVSPDVNLAMSQLGGKGICLREKKMEGGVHVGDAVMSDALDFDCVLRMAMKDFGVEGEEAEELIEEVGRRLVRMRCENLECTRVNFFAELSEDEQAIIFQYLEVMDRAIQELILHIPPMLDGECSINSECQESWLSFFSYLFEKTQNPIWQEMCNFSLHWKAGEFGVNEGVVKRYVKENRSGNDSVLLIGMCIGMSIYYRVLIGFYGRDQLTLPGSSLLIFGLFHFIFTGSGAYERGSEYSLYLWQCFSILGHHIIAMHIAKLVPAVAGRNYAIAMPILTELTRVYANYRNIGEYKLVEEGWLYFVAGALDIVYGAFIMYAANYMGRFLGYRGGPLDHMSLPGE